MISNNMKPAGTGGSTGAASNVEEGSRSAASSNRGRGRSGFSEMLRGLGANPKSSAGGRTVAGAEISESAGGKAASVASDKRLKGRGAAEVAAGEAATTEWARNTQDLASRRDEPTQGRGQVAGKHGQAATAKREAGAVAGLLTGTTAGTTAGVAAGVAAGAAAAIGSQVGARGTGAAMAQTAAAALASKDAGQAKRLATPADAAATLRGATTNAAGTSAQKAGSQVAGAGDHPADKLRVATPGARQGRAEEAQAAQTAKVLVAAEAESRKAESKLSSAQLSAAGQAADKLAADAGNRRRVDELTGGERSGTGTGRAEAARAADSAVAMTAAAASTESDPLAASRRETSTARRQAVANARSLAGDAEAGANERAGAGQAAGTPSTLSLATAEGGALRAVVERERAAEMPPQQMRAQDVAFQVQTMPTLSTAQPAGVPTVMIQPALTDPAFAQALGQQVSLLISGEINMAEMVVTPPEMGPVRIELSVRGDNADVVFTAAAPETLRAIEASGEVLKAMLAERGISLGSMDVGQGQAQSSSGTPGEGASHRQHASDRATTADQSEQNAESTVRTASSAVHRRGLVDLLA